MYGDRVVSKPIKFSIKLLVSIGLLALVFHYVPFSELARTLAGIELLALPLLFTLTVFQVVLSAVRLQILAAWQGIKVSYRAIVNINFVGMFYGMILPGDLAAGAVRWHRIYQIDRRAPEALAAIVFARILNIAILLLLGLCFALFDSQRPFGSLLLPLIGGLFCGLLGFLWLSKRLALREEDSDTEGRSYAMRLVAKLAKLARVCVRYQNLSGPPLVYAVMTTVFEHLAGVLFLYAAVSTVGAEISLAEAGWARTALILVYLLPVPMSGIGIREGALLLLLVPYGIDGPMALAVSVLMLGSQLCNAVIGSVIECQHWLSRRRTTPPVSEPSLAVVVAK